MLWDLQATTTCLLLELTAHCNSPLVSILVELYSAMIWPLTLRHSTVVCDARVGHLKDFRSGIAAMVFVLRERTPHIPSKSNNAESFDMDAWFCH
jgi:hypothetical protein